jgi:diaminohydroxyphosphoribosylaminopyrimidine deaminase / 5-amino-6-(5-phosphoribosylamino)uracil reductase
MGKALEGSRPSKSDFIKFMQLALKEAARGVGLTTPNPAVGAVIVKNGQIVGKGYHHKAGSPHAEIQAIKSAGDNCVGGVMFVTLEPCSHWGKTAPCTEAILNSGICGLVYAASDPNPLASGGGEILKSKGIWVESGVLSDQARELNLPFFTSISKKRPFIILKMAMTMDGHIAQRDGNSKYITGSKARKLVHQWRNQYDSILVGGNTISLDDPLLNCRLETGGRDPIRIILDSKLSHVTNEKRITDEKSSQTIVFTSELSSIKSREELEAKGVKVVLTDLCSNGLLNLNKIVKTILSFGINSILVEGGSKVASSFMEQGLIDKVAMFYAPKLLLDCRAPLSFASEKNIKLDNLIELENTSIKKVGEDFLIMGDVKYPREWI